MQLSTWVPFTVCTVSPALLGQRLIGTRVYYPPLDVLLFVYFLVHVSYSELLGVAFDVILAEAIIKGVLLTGSVLERWLRSAHAES